MAKSSFAVQINQTNELSSALEVGKWYAFLDFEQLVLVYKHYQKTLTIRDGNITMNEPDEDNDFAGRPDFIELKPGAQITITIVHG